MEAEQIVIVGGGPAGIAAALELKRQGYDPVIYERERLGGLLVNANWVENYPGFPEGINGLELAEKFVRQAGQKNIRVVIGEVTNLAHEKDKYRMTFGKNILEAEYVIVASGTVAKTIADITTNNNARSKVFHEVYPLLESKGKKVVIIGAGDAAFDYALNLAKNNEVTILNRSEGVSCAPHLWKKVSDNDSISYYRNVNVILPCEFNDGKLTMKCEGPCDKFSLIADYLLLAIGRTARLDFLSERLPVNAKILEDSGRLFFVGDVKNGNFRQTGIAVGEGIMAAMKIGRSISEKK